MNRACCSFGRCWQHSTLRKLLVNQSVFQKKEAASECQSELNLGRVSDRRDGQRLQCLFANVTMTGVEWLGSQMQQWM